MKFIDVKNDSFIGYCIIFNKMNEDIPLPNGILKSGYSRFYYGEDFGKCLEDQSYLIENRTRYKDVGISDQWGVLDSFFG